VGQEGDVKIAHFDVRATVQQSARWKQAAEAEGYNSVGAWLAGAADAYLKVRQRAGLPLPLAWRRGKFKVRLSTGEMVAVSGHVSGPFGTFCGRDTGPAPYGHCKQVVLVYIPEARILAMLRRFQQCKELAGELSRTWVRWGGQEPAEDPAPLLQRFQREDV
jgi:hypothetical protein